MSFTDEKYMYRCLQLAKNGLAHAMPNPSVGAVIVYKDSIIGEGYTSTYGGNHAEVNAIKSVKNKKLLPKSTLYVSLEPCTHHGKTPPCTNLILESEIPKVVIACLDNNKAVKGKGVERLEAAGITVSIGTLEEEAIHLNRRFFTFNAKARPYIILKWAETEDGFMDIDRTVTPSKQKDGWITSEKSKQLVHKWRSEEQAIMVGTNTAQNDNPQLTVREVSGKNPLRIVLDMQLRLPKDLHVFDQHTPTLIFNSMEEREVKNLEYLKVKDSDRLIDSILTILYERNIQSMIIEGGARLLNTFIEKKLWDEARVFKSTKLFGKGLRAPIMKTPSPSTMRIDSTDLLETHFNTKFGG